MSAVAAMSLRASKLEAELEGKKLNIATISTVAQNADDDARASAWYHRHLLQVFTEEVLSRVAEN